MQKLVSSKEEYVNMNDFVYDKKKIYVYRQITPKFDNSSEKEVKWGIFSEHAGEYGGYGFIMLGNCSNGWTSKPEWNKDVKEYFSKMIKNSGCTISDILIFKDLKDFLGWMSYEVGGTIGYLKYCE
jgi:hypothetical protein